MILRQKILRVLKNALSCHSTDNQRHSAFGGIFLSGICTGKCVSRFPSMPLCLLAVFLIRSVTVIAWLTLVCMIGGIAGTCIEFMGPLMAPSLVLIGIIASDAVAAGLLARGLWLGREVQKIE